MMELLVQGGWVMIPILICSVLAITIFIERLLRFYLINRTDPYATFEKVWQLVKKDDVAGALSICEEKKNPIVKVVAACLSHYEEDIVDIEEAVNHEGSKSIQSLEKNVRGLAIIAHTSPLLGLLGTIIGIIKAFIRVEAVGGKVDVSVLAGGIWEALLTTAFGLAVAIPSFLMYHYLDSQVDNYTLLMKDISRELLKLIKSKKNHHGHGQRTRRTAEDD